MTENLIEILKETKEYQITASCFRCIHCANDSRCPINRFREAVAKSHQNPNLKRLALKAGLRVDENTTTFNPPQGILEGSCGVGGFGTLRVYVDHR